MSFREGPDIEESESFFGVNELEAWNFAPILEVRKCMNTLSGICETHLIILQLMEVNSVR